MYITADDFGLHQESIIATLQLIRSKKISHVSLLVNMPFSHHAVKEYKKYKNCSIGLHFNCVEGFPLADPRSIKSLVNNSGQFYPLPTFLLRLFAGKINPADLRKEITFQIEFMIKQRLPVYHLNSHQNVHLFEPIYSEFIVAAKKHNVSLIRQKSSVIRRLKKWPHKLVVFESVYVVSRKLNRHVYGHMPDFEEKIIHPGTQYD